MKRNEVREIAIFEPWGLGDVVIALYAAKGLKEKGCEVTVICDPVWAPWVESLDFIKNTIPFHAPWTEKIKKYSLRKYRFSEVWHLRDRLKNISMDYLCEIRGDIRNVILLNILMLCPVVSFIGQKFKKRWHRAGKLVQHFETKFKCLNKESLLERHYAKDEGKQIFCFFGSAWKNKQVPISKSIEIVLALLKNNFSVTTILQPEDSQSNWDFLKEKYGNQISLLQTDMVNSSKKLSKAKILITTDSGWLHMAHFYGVPTIGLFGFQNAEEWSPPNCHIVYSKNVMPRHIQYNLSYENTQPLSEISITEILKITDAYFKS